MTSKCALIVDDSRSARHVLQRMLEAHELDVATAESAEQALEYLTERRPDVIFMDHMMPGMDGFEAVRAIKQNPATATIPIMMYTSQEGELYVGQARALGAVGVLPKQVAPVEVSRVLRSLRLVSPADVDLDIGTATMASDTPALATVAADAERHVDEDRDLREWLADLFDEQRAVIRRDLLDSYEAIAARVAEEIAPADAAAADDAPAERVGTPVALALAALCAVALVFAWLYWRAENKWQQAEALVDELAVEQASLRTQAAGGAIAAETSRSDARQSGEARYDAALAMAAWSFNSANRYSWNSVPLDDQLATRLGELVARLAGTGFVGTVLVETHVGEFCTVNGVNGEPQLPSGDLPAADCATRELSVAAADRLGSQQSVGFANFVETVGERTDGRIAVAVATLANTVPVRAYPDAATATAGAWNAAATANQRVEIRFERAVEDAGF